MIKSIRQYLLIYIGLSVFLIAIIFSSSLHYYLDRKDIGQHLDSVMALDAISLSAAMQDLNPNNFRLLQKKIHQIPSIFKHIHQSHLTGKAYRRNFHLQIMDTNGNVLMQSLNTPNFPKTIIQHQGFQEQTTNHLSWRLFVVKNRRFNVYIVLSENDSYRDKIVRKIIIEDLSILLLLFTILGVFIWLIIEKSIQPLYQITKEVSTRSPYNLEPVKIQNMPNEVAPLITSINDLLERLKEAISREQAFAANAAHELRTPLAVIKTLAQTACKTKKLKEINEALHKINDNVDRGAHVVEQLLNMSQTMPQTLLDKHFVSLDLISIAKEVIAEQIPWALEKELEITFESPPTIPFIWGNKIAIEILIRNLIDNAIRYTLEKTKIAISISMIKNQVVFEVRDEGPGIPKNKREHIFERFYRINGHKNKGSGLGLAIVQQIAETHQASIRVESQPKGKGTIFMVEFNTNLHQL